MVTLIPRNPCFSYRQLLLVVDVEVGQVRTSLLPVVSALIDVLRWESARIVIGARFHAIWVGIGGYRRVWAGIRQQDGGVVKPMRV